MEENDKCQEKKKPTKSERFLSTYLSEVREIYRDVFQKSSKEPWGGKNEWKKLSGED